jgi:hypothetical protein
MNDHIQEAIDAFNGDISKGVQTPAGKGLFELDLDSNPLNKTEAELFHHIVAKLLYVCKRCRLDIGLAIAFLCTRVSKSTNEDKEKLRRLLRYLERTKQEHLTLGATSFTTISGYIDAAYAVHPDRKSHTGGCITFGRGTLMMKSEKQKLNTKSSTEAEVVGNSDLAPDAIWAQRFLSAQGYDLKVELPQDNTSAIKMETNGLSSCGKKSKHIDIRYFWLKDRIARGELEVKYCPTEHMIADFFTKPLQGKLFQRLKDVIMGRIDIETFRRITTVSKERVGICDNDTVSHTPVTSKRLSYADVAKQQNGRLINGTNMPMISSKG